MFYPYLYLTLLSAKAILLLRPVRSFYGVFWTTRCWMRPKAKTHLL